MTEPIAAFSLEQVHRLTCLSESQLIDWDASGFFSPSFAYPNRRAPHSRIYSFEDVVGLRTLSILRERVSMQHLREVAERLKEHSGKPWSRLTLYTLNGEVHFKRPKTGEIEGAVTGQYGATIPLESVAEEMRIKAEAMKKRSPATFGKIEKHRFVAGGVAVVAGTRVPVSSIVGLYKAGYSIKDILEEYPVLKNADVRNILIQEGLTRAA
jgi:uncharacterized protein (DUF433 family)